MNLFENLAAEATQHDLRFLVIGGHAVAFHGFQRGTEDADILVNRTECAAWRDLVSAMGYRLVNAQESFLQFESPAADDWDLDLMIVPPETFERLYAAAATGVAERGNVRFASFEHLIAMKAHALKHGKGVRVLKDLTDVATLLRLKQVRLDAGWLKDVFDRNGTPEMYERIQRLVTE